MNIKALFLVVAAFIFGIVSTLALTYLFPSNTYSPSSTTTYVVASEKTSQDNSNIVTRILGTTNEEKASPYDRISESMIKVEKDKVSINIQNAEWSRFTDTNSMDPIIDEAANAIQIVPKSEAEIHIGDIVSYVSDYADGIIIHRVVEIAYDEKGWYCIMKGDNNPRIDPGKIRFSQIRRVVVAIIY